MMLTEMTAETLSALEKYEDQIRWAIGKIEDIANVVAFCQRAGELHNWRTPSTQRWDVDAVESESHGAIATIDLGSTSLKASFSI